MRTRSPKCNYHWSWKLIDGRKKCRYCGHRYTSQNIWDACRLSEKNKIKLWLTLDKEELDDPKDLVKDVSTIGHYGTGDSEILLKSKE